jgi:hypothetical protein
MKTAIGAFAVMALMASQALAAETTAPLPAGKPAGVHEAAVRHHRFPLLLTVGVAAVVVAGVVVATQNGGGGSCGSACSATGTSP